MRQSSSHRFTRRAALRVIAAGAGITLAAACAPASPTSAPATGATQAAPAAAGGQRVPLRWFFWTATEEERQFWESLATDAMAKVPNVDLKFETDTFNNFWTRLPTMVAAGNLPDI